MGTDIDLAELAARVQRLEQENDQLKAQLATVLPQPDPVPDAGPATKAGGAPTDRPIPRRHLLRNGAALAGAVAAGAVLADAQPAAATDNAALVVGQSNSATKPTSLVSTGFDAVPGFAVTDGSYALDEPCGLYAVAQNNALTTAGVFVGNGAAAALRGISSTGPAVTGVSDSSGEGIRGISFSGNGAAISSKTGIGAQITRCRLGGEAPGAVQFVRWCRRPRRRGHPHRGPSIGLRRDLSAAP